jgi:hypothetical protein
MQTEQIDNIKHIGEIKIRFDSDGKIIQVGGTHIVRYYTGDVYREEVVGCLTISPKNVIQNLAKYIDWYKKELKKEEEKVPKPYSVKCLMCDTVCSAITTHGLLELITEHIRKVHSS